LKKNRNEKRSPDKPTSSIPTSQLPATPATDPSADDTAMQARDRADPYVSRNPASPDLATALFRQLLEEDWPLAPEHREDLRKSGLSDATIRRHRMFSVWRRKSKALLGFALPGLDSGMVIPFPDPAGGFMDHIRIKIFPPVTDAGGHSIKYLQPRNSPPHLYFPIGTTLTILSGSEPLWLVEGEKKALAVEQIGLPSIGFCGIQGWHTAGSRDLIPDFHRICLYRRRVELVPDGYWRTNPNVERGAMQLAKALEAHGSLVRLVVLPTEL
jgi:hypothetical protein